MKRRTVVFDLGGVVLHWQPAELLRLTLPHRFASGADASPLAEAFFESFRPGGAWAEFDRGSLSSDEVAVRIASGCSGLTRREVEIVMQAIPAHLQLRADTAHLIAELRAAGHRLLFLSNMPVPYVDHALRQLDRLGAFEDGIFSCEVGLVKPEPEIYALAEQRFGCAAAELVFFDDNKLNVECAAGRGWQARHFVDAGTSRGELGELGLVASDTRALLAR